MKLHFTILLILSLLSSLMFNSCKTSKSVTKDDVVMLQGPKILFLNYSIHKVSETDSEIRFVSKILADGELKSQKSKATSYKGDLVILQVNQNMEVLDSTIIENPLIKNVEYINDNNELAMKTVKLDEAQITLRIQLNLGAKAIKIEEVLPGNNRKLLTTTNLQTDE